MSTRHKVQSSLGQQWEQLALVMRESQIVEHFTDGIPYRILSKLKRRTCGKTRRKDNLWVIKSQPVLKLLGNHISISKLTTRLIHYMFKPVHLYNVSKNSDSWLGLMVIKEQYTLKQVLFAKHIMRVISCSPTSWRQKLSCSALCRCYRF